MNGGIIRKAPNTLAFSLMIYKRISQAGTEFLDSMRLAEVSCLSLWAHLGKTRQGDKSFKSSKIQSHKIEKSHLELKS